MKKCSLTKRRAHHIEIIERVTHKEILWLHDLWIAVMMALRHAHLLLQIDWIINRTSLCIIVPFRFNRNTIWFVGLKGVVLFYSALFFTFTVNIMMSETNVRLSKIKRPIHFKLYSNPLNLQFGVVGKYAQMQARCWVHVRVNIINIIMRWDEHI